MRWLTMAAVMAVATASPAMAQSADFRVGAVRYTMALPKGYCEPTRAEDVSRMHFAASNDKVGMTALSLVPCEPGDLSDYILVKAPLSMVDTPMTVAQLQKEAGAEFDQQGDVPLDGLEQDLSSAASERSGQKVEMKTAIGPRGRDDICLYLGGTATFEGIATLSMGGCMTSVGDRVVVIFVYGPGDDAATVRTLMARSRALAQAIRVKSGR